MTGSAADRDIDDMAPWRAALLARADLPPALPRTALCIESSETGVTVVGSIEPVLARAMADAGLPLRRCTAGWQVAGAHDQALAELAQWLDRAGITGPWRDELLAVHGPDDQVLGRIERAAVRPLGIATSAVHLVGWSAGGGVWVQQRAFDKSTDPGMWDTLTGGLRAAGETIDETLERETWEEAGLRLEGLQQLRHGGRLLVRRPVARGYMVERIDWYCAGVPDGVVPHNLDGEVAGFECVSLAALRQRLRDGAFTLEAALVFDDWLVQRASAAWPGGTGR